MSREISEETFKKARRWCAAQFSTRYALEPHRHPSHLASTILKEAAEKFELGGFGVEGWCNKDDATRGVDYVNMGDPYAATLAVVTSRSTARFKYVPGGWAELAPSEET